MFCSLAVLNPKVGHTMDVLSPFISVLCHSDWLFHGESCPCLDIVCPAVRGLPRVRAPDIVPCITSLQATLLFPHGVTIVCQLPYFDSFLFTPVLLRKKHTHLFSLLSMKPAEFFSVLSSQKRQDVFHSFWVLSSHSRTLLQATPALSLVASSLKSTCCDFSIFSALIV